MRARKWLPLSRLWMAPVCNIPHVLNSFFEQCRELTGNISRYESVFEKTATMKLLYRAFTGGELSLLDYLLELEYYFNS